MSIFGISLIAKPEQTVSIPTDTLEAQRLTADVLEILQIMRIALVEAAFNTNQDEPIDSDAVMIGAAKLLRVCEIEISAVETYLGEA